MHYETAKITKAGQITIPKNVRKILNSNVVSFAIDEETQRIYLTPVKDVGGALAKYAVDISFDEAREKAWKIRAVELTKKGK